MHTNAKSHVVRAPQHRLLYAAMVGLTLLVAGWTSVSLAATDLGLGCDQTARHLHDLDVDRIAVEALDIGEASDTAEESVDDLTESLAPVLFLTPRVASILEDVFGDRSRAVADAQADAAPETGPATSPVAGTADAGELELAEPVSPLYENAAILPRFQRQMYRTDI